MGEFDDVLAMEPGDEWDDYDPVEHAGPRVELAPIVAQLHLPAATIELRGDVPDTLVRLLEPLGALPEVRSPHRVVVPVEVARVSGADASNEASGDRWGVVDGERGELGLTGSPEELAGALTTQLVDLSRRADVRHVLLPVAGLRLPDGRGVLVVDPDTGRRRRLVETLAQQGAAVAGADHVVGLAGSRTLLACPAPATVPRGTDDTAPAVASMLSVELVLVADEDPAAAGAERLGRAHGAARLLAEALPGALDPAELVRLVTTLVAGADVWSVPTADPVAAAAFVSTLPDGAGPRELVTWRRPLPDRDDVVVVRFADGGVLIDQASAKVLELDPSELPAIDALRWSRVVEPAGQADLLEQLADAGVDLRSAAGASPVPAVGPEAYGVPDSPRGVASSAMWTAETIERSGVDQTSLASLMVHAAAVGDVVLDPATVDKLGLIAGEVEQRRRVTESVLDEVLVALDEHDVDALVLGSVVLAHDGPVPAELVEVDALELMVASEDLPAAVQAVQSLSSPAEHHDDGDGSVGVVPERSGASDGAPDQAAGAPAPDQEPPARDSSAVVHVERSGRSVPVSVLARIAAGPFGDVVDHDELLDRAVPVRFGGRWVRTLHPDDRTVLACARAADPSGGTLRELRSVVLESPASRDGMAAVLEASAGWGATRAVLDAVRLVDAALPGLSPWLVERANRPAPPPDRRRRRGLRRR